MNVQQILISILTFFGGGGLVSLVGYLVYRKRTKAETIKLEAEAKAKLAEAKNLEAQAANTLADATSEIINRFRELVKESEAKCKRDIDELKDDLEIIKSNYSKLKQAYDGLREEYSLLLTWAKNVAQILQDRRIPYPDPPDNLGKVIPRNGDNHIQGGYKL